MCTGQQCLPQGQGLWVQQTWVWHRPHHRAPRTYIGLGKQILGGHKQNLMHTRIQEKGAETPQETDPDLLMSVQEAEVWVGCGLGRGSECSKYMPFQGGRHYLHCLHYSWPQVKQQGGSTAPPINRKLD